ncbi:MAG: hypothetical protein FJX53_05785, partial [Alphaproteobacteria bacterium]|nr:hypothetical protein [Alphaproteobacteria bacterium]
MIRSISASRTSDGARPCPAAGPARDARIRPVKPRPTMSARTLQAPAPWQAERRYRSPERQPRFAGCLRLVLAGAVLAALCACGGPSGPQVGEVGYVTGFFGGVVADEPRAAIVGRDVLTAGGRASDAAIAAYFTMAVTMPSAASLGGGGACVMHDFYEKRDEAVVFLPGLARGGAGLGVVPGNVRGLFALHARYGRLPWANLLRPAELLARDGHAISRAFAHDLAREAGRLGAEP